ncbi:MAG: hypothetical protein ABSB39_07590 [Candidatus Sulfotelmatobacter sp.]|jgi:hypothetical protein
MNLKSFAKSNWALLLSGVIVLAGVIIFRLWINWDGVKLTVKVEDLAGLLAPLAFAATVIERGVEILISPWRDAGASKLQKAVEAIKARPADPATAQQNALDLKAASDALDEYRGVTQQYAFAVSLTLALLVSIAGVRALGPFLDKDFKFAIDKQRLFFGSVDVILSTAMLAGGADGVHSVVNAVTSFFNTTADKSKQQAAAA